MQFNQLELQDIINMLVSDPIEARDIIGTMNNLVEPISKELSFILNDETRSNDERSEALVVTLLKIPFFVISDGRLTLLRIKNKNDKMFRTDLIHMTFYATYIGIREDDLRTLVHAHCSRSGLDEEEYWKLCRKAHILFIISMEDLLID